MPLFQRGKRPPHRLAIFLSQQPLISNTVSAENNRAGMTVSFKQGLRLTLISDLSQGGHDDLAAEHGHISMLANIGTLT